MKIEDGDASLRELGYRVCQACEWLAGQPPEFQPGSGWYKAGDPIFVWFRAIGQAARTFPRDSIQVAAAIKDDSIAEVADCVGNNIWGESYEIIVRADVLEDMAKFFQFLGRAYLARQRD